MEAIRIKTAKKSLNIEKIQYYWHVLEPYSDHQKSATSLGVNFFRSRLSCRNAKFSIETLREEIKPVVTEEF